MNVFLQDPTKPVCKFVEEIKHLRFMTRQIDVSHEIDEYGHLIIAKTLQRHAKSHNEWKDRHDIAINRIKRLGPEGYLKSMLLDQYSRIMAALTLEAIVSKTRKAVDVIEIDEQEKVEVIWPAY